MGVAHFKPYLTTAFSRRAGEHLNADSDPGGLSGWPSARYQGIQPHTVPTLFAKSMASRLLLWLNPFV